MGSYFLLGAGCSGLAYLVYKGRQLSMERHAMEFSKPINGQTMLSPLVQQRIRSTLGYFGGGLAMTGAMVSALRNSSLAYMNPFVFMFGSLGLLIGTQMVNYETNLPLKFALWSGFMGITGLSLVPLINMAGMAIVYDALLATGLSMGGLGLVAYNAPSEEFLRWGGALGVGMGAMFGIGLVSMFYPSPALYNIWLYGGLALFSAVTLYDVQKIVYNAKMKRPYDPINESLAIYLDAVILFQKFLLIFMGNKKK